MRNYYFFLATLSAKPVNSLGMRTTNAVSTWNKQDVNKKEGATVVCQRELAYFLMKLIILQQFFGDIDIFFCYFRCLFAIAINHEVYLILVGVKIYLLMFIILYVNNN